MQISPCQWTRSRNDNDVETDTNHAFLYHQLMECNHAIEDQFDAAALIEIQLRLARSQTHELPDDPGDLPAWIQNGARLTNATFGEYLQHRKRGGERQYFTNRAHALYFLKSVAPTKLVDGAWLYGLCKYWRNPKFKSLIRTYLEELGDGEADKNHVLVYKALLGRYGVDTIGQLDNNLYTQGLIQLALAENADAYLPEIIGFNLGYEQLPLHLLISAYELNELNIDPHYFTLHITIDNAATGHAFRAVQAVLENLPRLTSTKEFWQRVQTGYNLSNAGTGTLEIIHAFDIEKEIVNIFTRKSHVGQGAHSDYCRVAGRHVNDWLSCKENIPEFLAALQKSNWIVRNQPVEKSRFWALLQGNRADMFGVFSPYELQVIHDWIRAEDSRDGQPYSGIGKPEGAMSFRTASSYADARGGLILKTGPTAGNANLLDSDLHVLKEKLLQLDFPEQEALLINSIAPGQHWTPAGIYANQLFNAMLHRI